MKKNSVVKLFCVSLMIAMLLPLSFGSVTATDSQGDMQNQEPFAVGTSSNRLETMSPEYDNSGSDVLTLYFTFKDNNSEADVSTGAGLELIVYIEPSADNDGYNSGDVVVGAWALDKTQNPNKAWIDDQGGATNGSNDDGTTTDGYLELEDENDDDDNFEYTIPSSWTASDYYSAQINFSDGGATHSSFLYSNFKVTSPITYDLAYSNGVWGPSYWGEWDAYPTDSVAPSDPDANTIAWLVVNNTGSDSGQQFTLSFNAENFTGVSHARWINIDYNVRWTYYETIQTVGNDNDPADVNWEDSNWTASDDADGDYTFTFTALGMHMWVIYELAQVTEDDGAGQPPIAGHNYDNVLRDDSYTVGVTLTPI